MNYQKLKMKALVTGGAGFIGSHLCEQLLSLGYAVSVIDNLSYGNYSNISHLEKNKNFKFYNEDITKYESIYKIFSHHDWVFHLAGIADIVPSIENPIKYFETNVKGTLNILECSKLSGIKRLIYAASSSCYGLPDNFPTNEKSTAKPQYPYALTKYIGEEIVMHWSQIYNVPSISLRLFNVYGPRSRTNGAYGAVFGVFLAQKYNNKPFTIVGDGNQTRDFTYVTDVASAFVLAAKSNISSEVINVGSGNHYSINKLVSLLDGDVIYVPKRPGEPDCTFADISKIRKLLNWEPKFSFEDGVEIMLKNIDKWSDAPIWDENSIKNATKSWFKYLG